MGRTIRHILITFKSDMPAGVFAKAKLRGTISNASSTLRKTQMPYVQGIASMAMPSMSGGGKINLASAF